jgi:hypothetical protein
MLTLSHYLASIDHASDHCRLPRPCLNRAYPDLPAGQFLTAADLLLVATAGYPALVAFKPKDQKYSLARSAFELGHVTEFVESLRAGKEPVLAVQVSMLKV